MNSMRALVILLPHNHHRSCMIVDNWRCGLPGDILNQSVQRAMLTSLKGSTREIRLISYETCGCLPCQMRADLLHHMTCRQDQTAAVKSEILDAGKGCLGRCPQERLTSLLVGIYQVYRGRLRAQR
ncbi:hypothetical protein OH76DRAFT_319697 [Lentinus brumalis]|uniref:Uncharacterized protein n=1 Tax=Lentinus brumalis TaxID=2498619 RepID=A0A371DFD7_9APHY|nr:hypothetical protein OH76DRAFT_319697 [Polyporus brumalis]